MSWVHVGASVALVWGRPWRGRTVRAAAARAGARAYISEWSTMSAALVLGLVGGLLVVAFLANRVFGLTRIPDVLVLMMLGVFLGPVLGLVQAASLAKTTNLLGTLASFLCCSKAGWSSTFATH
jgi:predicted lipid-binding transport protein (Tim44 family)